MVVRRVAAAVCVAVMGLTVLGCAPFPKVWGTPENPNVGLTSPYYGSDWGWFTVPGGNPLENTVTFHSCVLRTGAIKVALHPDLFTGVDRSDLGPVFTATITEPAGVTTQQLAVGDALSSPYVLPVGGCFSVKLAAPATLVPNPGCNGNPYCNTVVYPEIWQWPGTGYTITW